MKKTFFTSDTHFSHENIIRLSKRPFLSSNDMDSNMIRNWNSVVKPDDTVYHLGDYCFKNKALDILGKLNGKKHLIIGNHDTQTVQNHPGWSSVKQYDEITVDEVKVILFHYPILEWNGFYRNSYHLYGHVHNNLPDYHERSIDVGVDNQGFFPRTLSELIEKQKRDFALTQT